MIQQLLAEIRHRVDHSFPVPKTLTVCDTLEQEIDAKDGKLREAVKALHQNSSAQGMDKNIEAMQEVAHKHGANYSPDQQAAMHDYVRLMLRSKVEELKKLVA